MMPPEIVMLGDTCRPPDKQKWGEAVRIRGDKPHMQEAAFGCLEAGGQAGLLAFLVRIPLRRIGFHLWSRL